MAGRGDVIVLSSNNYLGLADHPDVIEAGVEALHRYGAGTASVRFICGTFAPHLELEHELAELSATAAALTYVSCWNANEAVIPSLADPKTVIISDELNHASIIDGCRASRAQTVVYRHLDTEHLDWSLRRHRSEGRRLIVTDSVFSMDGDLAPLEEIVELAQEHGARLVVDEAHATGVIGPGGRGAVADAGLEGEVDVLIGTLSKALGSYGAYACAEQTMVRYLINSARSLIYSTAPGPPAVAGALAALELLEQRPHRVGRLRSAASTMRTALAREGFSVPDGEMPIIPLIAGEEHLTMRFSQAALEHGVFAQAIRPPTVPAGTSRLRLAVMASHTERELQTAAALLGKAASQLGLDPAAIGHRPSATVRSQPPVSEQDQDLQFTESGSVPFDVEREDAVAHAA
jgi:glycine C-acetyltransferase/8-amino-7-oxononanoate synthase